MKALNHLGAVLSPCNDILVIRSWLLSLCIVRDLGFIESTHMYTGSHLGFGSLLLVLLYSSCYTAGNNGFRSVEAQTHSQSEPDAMAMKTANHRGLSCPS